MKRGDGRNAFPGPPGCYFHLERCSGAFKSLMCPRNKSFFFFLSQIFTISKVRPWQQQAVGTTGQTGAGALLVAGQLRPLQQQLSQPQSEA